ncbi:unnamed protein product [Ectocarpus sp. 13 AM-2016]
MLGRACVSPPLARLGAHAASGVELFLEEITRTRPPETLGTGQCGPCQGLFARLDEAPDGELQQSSQIELRGAHGTTTTIGLASPTVPGLPASTRQHRVLTTTISPP